MLQFSKTLIQTSVTATKDDYIPEIGIMVEILSQTPNVRDQEITETEIHFSPQSSDGIC